MGELEVVHVYALSSRVGLGRGSASGPGAGMARATDRNRGRSLKSCMVESVLGRGIDGGSGYSVYQRGTEVVLVLSIQMGSCPFIATSQRSGEMGSPKFVWSRVIRVLDFSSILLIGVSLASRLEEGPTFTVF